MAGDPPLHADLNFVLATLNEADALHDRATRFLRHRTKPAVPFAVGIELLHWCRKHGESYLGVLGACVQEFEVEKAPVLLSAGHLLEHDRLKSPFDAVHLAEAREAGAALLTADERLWKTTFPTERF